ncbi:hypothetical protein [Paenibacillus sp. OV219]|uniref:hypothetical protein n=1 Tax=Paenibacillus sp. OV219 TaxID=1884377 RepID=UPI0008CEC6AA|nr:hypothetical protein [Paenibacillus sp. OV219]SEN96133.1 hypothetical protein SAMN05518847_10574 [Paenibacillus sp. OV219]
MLPLSFTTEEAIEFAEHGCIEEWVHLFLKTAGGNEPFSEGLKLQPRYWTGPVRLPLQELIRCCGPEAEMEYCVSQGSWDMHVAELMELYRKGWSYPPLIVQLVDGHLSIRDGNHRHEAMQRLDFADCWVILWDSESKENLDQYVSVSQGRNRRA